MIALRRAARAVLLLMLACCGAIGAALAQDVQPVPPLTGRVIDSTGTLTPAQSQALEAKLASIETRRGSQLVVLIVPTTAPEDIAAYGQRVADQWKIGRRGIGDGLVILVAKNDRRMRIEVAKTLEGAVPDALAGRIISEQLAPAFRNNDYAGGLNAAIDRIDQRIGNEGLAAPAERAPGAAAHARSGFDWQDLAIFLFVGVPIAGAVLTSMFGRKLGSLVTGGAVGAIGWWLTASALIAAGAGLVALFVVGVMGVGGGGGGFSSGGGGDFGGGGASGSW